MNPNLREALTVGTVVAGIYGSYRLYKMNKENKSRIVLEECREEYVAYRNDKTILNCAMLKACILDARVEGGFLPEPPKPSLDLHKQ